MRKASLLIMVLAMLLIPLVARGQNLSIVYVDLKRVMVESDKGKEASKSLTEEADKLKKSLDVKQDELQTIKDTIEKQGATITPEARAEKEKQYQTKVKDFQRLAGDYEADLRQKDTEFSQKILKDIEEVIKTIAERDKYTFILERSQAGILFGSPSADITTKVITLYNEVGKKKPAK